MSDVKLVEISVWTTKDPESPAELEVRARMEKILQRNSDTVQIMGDRVCAQVRSDVVGVLMGWLREYGCKHWIVKVTQ